MKPSKTLQTPPVLRPGTLSHPYIAEYIYREINEQ